MVFYRLLLLVVVTVYIFLQIKTDERMDGERCELVRGPILNFKAVTRAEIIPAKPTNYFYTSLYYSRK